MTRKIYMKKQQFPNASCKSYAIEDKVFLHQWSENNDIEPAIRGLNAAKGAPLIGVLLAREGEAYMIDEPYIEAVTTGGANIRLIHYDKVAEQLDGVDGLLLIGGFFPSPREWFVPDNPELPDLAHLPPRTQAYVTAIDWASKHKLPMLGICGGMQMMAAFRGGHLAKVDTMPANKANVKAQHRGISANSYAHKIGISPHSRLFAAANTNTLMVNSVHSEMVIDVPQDKVMVTAIAPDGVIEAIEYNNYDGFALGVQWHPERMAGKGDAFAKNIYAALIEAAKKYKKAKG